MAITINFNTRVINVPKSFMTAISATLYELDVNALRLALKDIEDEDGITYPDTHRHNTEVVLAGTTYARSVEFINGFTITFEDGQYAVRCVGANHNISDVKNLNQVSLIIGNSAGLQTVNTGGGVGTVAQVADAVWNAIASNYLTAGSTGAKLNAAGSAGDPWSTDLSTYNTAGTAGYIAKATKADTTTIINEFGNISVASSAVNTSAVSFTLTTGTVSTGTYLDTKTFDAGEHHLTSTGTPDSIIDAMYEFQIGAEAIPSNFTFLGHTLPQNHVVMIQAYNWNSTQYETIGEITGVKTNNIINCALFNDQVGTGANLGKVRIRFYVSNAVATELHIDQIYVSYSVLVNNPTAVEIAEEVRTELTPELTHILQVPTTSSSLSPTQATMLLEMYTLLGLDPTKPLVVTPNSRTAGTISQGIATDQFSTQVQRV